LLKDTSKKNLGVFNEEQSSYRQIFKATSLFGGVQVVNILIGIVKNKFVAVLLGATGVGIFGLLNAPLQLILSVTGLGITFSAVRDISEAHASNDQTKLAKAIITLRRWSWFAGLLGVVLTATLAPFLSKWTFGDYEYTWAFIWLSVTLLLQTISKGQIAILQSLRRLKDLAKASVFGSLVGLFTSVPMYYFFGVNGIVPSLVATAVTTTILSWNYSRKVKIELVKMSFHDTFHYGENMVKLGLVITITGIVGFLTSYILNASINRIGGVDQVGLYNAGWNVIGQSTSLVFTAMTTDYFPRLSAVNQDEDKIRVLVNQQAEMVILILSPIIILLIGAMPVIIRLLYTSAFLPVVIFANWTLLSILLKGLVWPIGFIFPAKGDVKTFGLIEISAAFFNILTNILGYYLYRLEGLGISFILNYMFGLVLYLVFANKKYGFKYEKMTLRQFYISLLFVLVAFSISYFIDQPVSYLFLAVVFIVTFSYTLFELNKKAGLKTVFTRFLGRLPRK